MLTMPTKSYNYHYDYYYPAEEAPPAIHEEAPPAIHEEAPPTIHEEAPPTIHAIGDNNQIATYVYMWVWGKDKKSERVLRTWEELVDLARCKRRRMQ